MPNYSDELNFEDFMEPRCVVCDVTRMGSENTTSLPMDRIVPKYDEYMEARDYTGAERHLAYWYEEARFNKDLRGMFSIANEYLGHYRNRDMKDKAYEWIDTTLELLKQLDMEGSISEATCFTNVATVLNAFKDTEKAVSYYEKALPVYEANLKDDDERLGGLYNNMALALNVIKEYDRSIDMFKKAIKVMQNAKRPLEQAISYLNLANTYADKYGDTEGGGYVSGCLDKAADIYDDPKNERTNYYAYVIDRSRDTFEYFGWVSYAEELDRRRDEIYARS